MAVNVLIVEDNPAARSFLGRVVAASFTDDIVVREVGDLESARRMLQRGGPGPEGGFQLLLVDLELPDGNGVDLLGELRTHTATKIVTSLYSDDEHLFPALQNGADGYLLKEDRFEVLVEELQKIIRGQPPLSPAIARRLLTHFRSANPTRDAAGHSVTLGAHRFEPDPQSGTDRLTPRESEVLTFMSKGFTIKEISNLMGIRWHTVNDHIKSIYRKLNVSSRAEAAVVASKHGLV
jgi:two-component system, NarL family, nitrate/nitrite response regulator NarL